MMRYPHAPFDTTRIGMKHDAIFDDHGRVNWSIMRTVNWCFEYQVLGLLSGAHRGGPRKYDYAVNEVAGWSVRRLGYYREHVEGL